MNKEVNLLDQRAREVLEGNDKGGYTIPTAGLYPYQWNWDSAFAAWASRFLTLKELGRKLKHSLLGSGLMECSPIFFFAEMTQIIFLVQRFGARKELGPSHLVE